MTRPLLVLLVALGGCAIAADVPDAELDAVVAPELGDATAEGDTYPERDATALGALGLGPGTQGARRLSAPANLAPRPRPNPLPSVNVAGRTDFAVTGPVTPSPATAKPRPRLSVLRVPPVPDAEASLRGVIDAADISVHSDRRATLTGHVSPVDICAPWRAAHDRELFEDMPCDVALTSGDLSLVESPYGWGSELLLVRNTAAGETEVLRVADSEDGVNWDETLVVRSLERQRHGDRVLIRLELTGDGHACSEPEAYRVRERQLVICDADVCTRPIPLRRREVTTRFRGVDWEDGVDRVTANFRLRVRMTPDGVRVSRRRGRVPPEFREFLGRHSLEDLAPEA